MVDCRLKRNRNLISIILTMVLLVIPLVIAQEEIDPGITPDMSIIYGIDRALERIRMTLTFGDEDKVNYGLKVAEERLAEIRVMHERDNLPALERAREGYGDIVDEIENKTEISEDVKIRVRENLQGHLVILREVSSKVPEQTREGLQNIIRKTERVREQFR